MVKLLHRQSHDIEIGSLDPFHTDIADPFLDAIGSRLVNRIEPVDIISQFPLQSDS